MEEENGHISALILVLGDFSLEPDSSQALFPRCVACRRRHRYYQNRYLAQTSPCLRLSGTLARSGFHGLHSIRFITYY
ncbi:hypothetical protein H6G36_26970 [Anabaena minutissima FACHB-250]|nr:hypothetical protein [Anabaena minutissima FACHB-250]